MKRWALLLVMFATPLTTPMACGGDRCLRNSDCNSGQMCSAGRCVSERPPPVAAAGEGAGGEAADPSMAGGGSGATAGSGAASGAAGSGGTMTAGSAGSAGSDNTAGESSSGGQAHGGAPSTGEAGAAGEASGGADGGVGGAL